MRKIKTSYNIDKLKVCFRQSKEIFTFFADTKPNTKVQRDGYYIFVLGDEFEEDDNPILINTIVYFDDGTKLGTLRLNNSKKYDGYAFFEFENKVLYNCLTSDMRNGTKYNIVPCLDMIADDLGLVFNNITEIEVACDTTINVSAKIRKMIKDSQNYEMIKNGKRIKDPKRKIEDYFEVFERTRDRLSKYPALYFKQKKPDDPFMRIYNKTTEINDNENVKKYVNDWNDFGKSQTYRIEIRLKNEDIKQFLTKRYYERPLLLMLDEPDFKEDLWRTFTNRLVYFKDANGSVITMYDLAKGLI